MNERIKELADKVTTLMPGVYNIEYESGKSVVEFTEDALEKFAELIVRECIEKGNVLMKHYIINHSEQEQVFLLAAIADYSNEIKQHFGVEE